MNSLPVNNKVASTNIDLGLLILRLSLGILMLMHGVHKLFNGVDHVLKTMADSGLPTFLGYGVYVGEIIAPIMLIFGFRTRIAAGLFAGTVAVAILTWHLKHLWEIAPRGGWIVELNALFLFGAVALFFTGAGKYALSTTKKWD